jgi:predicted RNA binding protein YcfA (HicA-like mRNA interferase family)
MSPLPYDRLRSSLTTRKLISALLRDGFEHKSTTGSHRKYVHPDGRRVTVTYHSSGSTFTMRTLRSMLELQARWTENDLNRLILIK